MFGLMKNVSIGKRLALAFGVLIVLSAMQGLLGLYYMGQVNQRAEDMYTQELVTLEALDDAKSATYRIRGDALEHILASRDSEESRLEGEIQEQESRVYERIEQYRSTRLRAEERRLLEEFESSFGAYMRRVEGEILPLSESRSEAQAGTLALGESVEEFRSARDAMNDLMDYNLARAEYRYEQAVDDYYATLWIVVATISAISVIGGLVAFFLTRAITRPLRAVIGYFGEIARGRLDNDIRVHRRDEIGEVLMALGDTQSRLKTNIESRRRAEEERLRIAEDFAQTIQMLPNLVFKWRRDDEGRLYPIYTEGTITQDVGVAAHSVNGKTPEEVYPRGFLDQMLPACERAFAGQTADLLVRSKDRVYDGVVKPVRNAAGDAGDVVEVAGFLVDVTERETLQEQLAHQAFHGPLTELPNRALFADRLGHALVRTSRQEERVAVLYMDLDNFKVINDSLGHEAGDQLLVEVAGRLRACVRSQDTIARFGGDEFVVLLEDIGERRGAIRVAECIIEEFRPPFALEGRDVFVAASIGIAFSDSVPGLQRDLLREADTAMYRAKATRGDNPYAVFESSMNAQVIERLEIENDLRRALRREEFVVYYQPKVSLGSGRVVGMEALVRWEHPERGLMMPDDFIPLAEETGLIVPLGRWVLREACRQASRWQKRYPADHPLVMNVNLSARQLRQPGLAEEVAAILKETGLRSFDLDLEITESVLMENLQSTTAALRGLKELGVRLAVDDFGTGYSSLAYLNDLSVDELKIDKTFVMGLGSDPGSTVIVSAMVGLAHALGLKVVAEGVETAEQLDQLRELGCEMAQGFLFARPLPPEAMQRLLETDSGW